MFFNKNKKHITDKGSIEGLEANINSCIKALQIMKRTRSFGQVATIQGKRYFDITNVKGIKSEVAVRKFDLPSYEQVTDLYLEMFEGFRSVVAMSELRNFSQIF